MQSQAPSEASGQKWLQGTSGRGQFLQHRLCILILGWLGKSVRGAEDNETALTAMIGSGGVGAFGLQPTNPCSAKPDLALTDSCSLASGKKQVSWLLVGVEQSLDESQRTCFGCMYELKEYTPH